MRRLRVSTDQLLKADPQLGHKFAAVSRDLEELTKSIPLSHKLSIDDGAGDELRAVDPFGRLLLKQRGLLKERDNLISRIRAFPGFDSFFRHTGAPFCRLIWWGSDILILLHNASPSLISTPHDFYDRANALRDRLLDLRNRYGLDSSHYDETVASVLAELYELVGKPVVDRLHQLNILEQSRIWWCLTSVFCSHPLHVMGPIPSDDSVVRYFLDLYICSYTPTLSALIQSPRPISSDRGGEIQVVQRLDTEMTSFVSEAATPAAVIDGLHHHQFIYFACHGTQEAVKPFEAGFELYGDKRLTLLDIVRSALPTAEFAFLSACHTAEVTEGSVVDEGLHLAAAVQCCRFRSGVGTMGAMVDEDGRDLAEYYILQVIVLCFETRPGGSISRTICESPPGGSEEAAEEEADLPGEMDEFRSLGLVEYGFRAYSTYCLSIAMRGAHIDTVRYFVSIRLFPHLFVLASYDFASPL
ncbi:hypothetical protein EDB84DRAFT_1568141 [Lactarius hengduanensis]|nr:hypothetical protein EDB84DRAFT_1568141 [Lactarius hengduanensis]